MIKTAIDTVVNDIVLESALHAAIVPVPNGKRTAVGLESSFDEKHVLIWRIVFGVGSDGGIEHYLSIPMRSIKSELEAIEQMKTAAEYLQKTYKLSYLPSMFSHGQLLN